MVPARRRLIGGSGGLVCGQAPSCALSQVRGQAESPRRKGSALQSDSRRQAVPSPTMQANPFGALNMSETRDIFDVMYTNRSHREFTGDPIPDELIERVLDAAVRAPSGSNSQKWRFVVITAPE